MEQLIAKMLQSFEDGKMTRRQLIQSLALAATAASTATATIAAAEDDIVKAVALNHVEYSVSDYAKTRDWYVDLFGLKVVTDDGKGRAKLAVGDSFIILHAKQNGIADHICFTLADWDTDKSVRDKVGAELKRRGTVEAQTPNPRSFFIKNPDGYMVQIGGKEQ